MINGDWKDIDGYTKHIMINGMEQALLTHNIQGQLVRSLQADKGGAYTSSRKYSYL